MLIDPIERGGGPCDGINLEAFDMWAVQEPVNPLSVGGLGEIALFEGAICEVALWDWLPAHLNLLGMPRSNNPLIDKTNLLAYWPLAKDMFPYYVDTGKNDYDDCIGTKTSNAFFGAHPFPIEQSPLYCDIGQVIERAVPIFVDAVYKVDRGTKTFALEVPDRTVVVDDLRTVVVAN